MATKTWGIALVILITLFTSSAQILYKHGADRLSLDLISVLTNYYILGGLCLYGIGMVLLLMALKAGEVTVLYPMIATSYIWVAVLAKYFFNEPFTSFKIAGIGLIVFGVLVVSMGRGKKQEVAA